jgi:hypothetical protein
MSKDHQFRSGPTFEDRKDTDDIRFATMAGSKMISPGRAQAHHSQVTPVCAEVDKYSQFIVMLDYWNGAEMFGHQGPLPASCRQGPAHMDCHGRLRQDRGCQNYTPKTHQKIW